MAAVPRQVLNRQPREQPSHGEQRQRPPPGCPVEPHRLGQIRVDQRLDLPDQREEAERRRGHRHADQRGHQQKHQVRPAPKKRHRVRGDAAPDPVVPTGMRTASSRPRPRPALTGGHRRTEPGTPHRLMHAARFRAWHAVPRRACRPGPCVSHRRRKRGPRAEEDVAEGQGRGRGSRRRPRPGGDRQLALTSSTFTRRFRRRPPSRSGVNNADCLVAETGRLSFCLWPSVTGVPFA